MPRSEFGDFLARSLAILERERPRHYAALCAAMRDRVALFRVDGPPVLVSFGEGRATVDPVITRAPVGIESALSKQTILDLLDGELSLEEAVLSDRFFVRAPVSELHVFFQALLHYLRGAVRCPSLPTLLAAYRRGDAPAAART
jgi:hypothetical protein